MNSQNKMLLLSFAMGIWGLMPCQAQHVTMKAQGITVKEALQKVKASTGYSFVYYAPDVNDSKKVNVNLNNATITDAVEQILKNQGLQFEVKDKTVVIRRAEKAEDTKQQQPQGKRKVTGHITDANGEPIIGAAVRVKGSKTATVTDIDGNFVLDGVDSNSKLEVTYIGFQPKELAIGNNRNIEAVMQEDNAQIEEVVVVGYGVSKKKDFTGSLTSVSSDNIVESHKQSAAGALQGTIAGVDITRNGNNPGAGFNIMVRGQNTITNNGTGNANGINTPLYVIDGMMMDNMDDISPDDIERIDVLKDASSTAIYGSRGSNGVVIVTTKKGSEVKEKTNVEYNGFVSFTSATHLPDMLDGQGFADYKVERYMGNNWKDYTYTGKRASYEDALTTQAYNNFMDGKSVDWVDELLQTAVSQNHSLRVYGSGKGLVYSFGAAYTDESGVTDTDNYKRYNFSASVDKQINHVIKMGMSIYTAYTKTVTSPETVRQAFRLNPLTDMYNEDGSLRTFPDNGLSNVSNPLVERQNDTTEKLALHTFGNFYLQVQPVEWLIFKTQFAPDAYFDRWGMYYGAQSKNGKGNMSNATAETNNTNSLKYTWTNTLNFDKTFAQIHRLNVMVGSEWVKTKEDAITTHVKNFSTDLYKWYNLAAAANKTLADVVGSDYIQDQWLSFFSRINYSYNDRYLLTFTGRYDGSSRLAAGHRWKFFPSAALGWRISEEEFIKKYRWIDNLKLRVSYGMSGNNHNVEPYSTESNILNYSYNFGSSRTASIIKNLPNSSLTWETTKEWNFGLDFSFLRGRIQGTVDYYRRRTDNILMNRVLSEMNGYSSVMDNVGVVDNNGIEVSLNVTPVRVKDFTWNMNINFTQNHNEIKELVNGATRDEANEWFVGESVGAVWNYKKVGYWKQGDEGYERALSLGLAPGSIKVYEKDGYSGDWTTTSDDKVILGSRYPKWTGGLTSTFTYKDLSLAVNIYTRQGQWSYSQFHWTTARDDNQLFNHLNLKYWSEANQNDNDIEWCRPGLSNPGEITALLWQKTSFWKVGYITLGYNVPAKFLSKFGISKLHTYVSCQNPFVITDYDGLDPEAASNGTDTMYFMTKSWEIGLNLTF